MSSESDQEFYHRAHEHLRVANEQTSDVSRGEVSASLMYACARFNVWVSAANRGSPEDLKAAYGKTIEYFVGQYRRMLVKNLDDYVDNFHDYRARADRDPS